LIETVEKSPAIKSDSIGRSGPPCIENFIKKKAKTKQKKIPDTIRTSGL